ncbi:MAG: DUF6484 domain-containing protein [Nannocystaceae bacterium]|nr:DUF6484 domain-containing protein [bacterium]
MAEQKVVVLQRAPDASIPEGAALGWVVRVDDEGIWVDAEDNDTGPMLALSVAVFDRDELEAAIADRREAVLMFVAGSPNPVLLGLRQPNPVIEGTMDEPEGASAIVDGKKVRLEGQDEIVLRCGKSSITMRRNGRVVIRGVQVESRATGRNRIKGGAVLIN